MNILFVSDTYYPHINGVYYFVCRIAPLLQERGHQVAVIAPSETTFSTLKKIDNVDVYGIPSAPVLLYPNVRAPIPFVCQYRVEKLLKNIQPDVIHIQDHFGISRAVINANKKLNIPVIGTNHFMAENVTALVTSNLFKRILYKSLWSSFSVVYNQLSYVTTPSEAAAKMIRPKLSLRVAAVSSGIDLQQFSPGDDSHFIRQKYGIPGSKPVLLYVGRVDPEKNLEQVIHAVALASKKIDFHFVLVGKGVRKTALEGLARELKIEDKVTFTGFVPESDLPHIYRMSDCFIIASIAELLSLATLQAMASGLPVIAADAGALSELVEEGVTGFLFMPGDINKIVELITILFTNESIGKVMGKKGREISKKHDMQEITTIFERIYQKLAGENFIEPKLSTIANKTNVLAEIPEIS